MRRLAVVAALLVTGCSPDAASKSVPRADVRPADQVVDVGDGVDLELVLVQPGEFTMLGGPAAHRARVDAPYYLGRYEVTEAQWTSVTGTVPTVHRGDSSGRRAPVQHLNYPDCVRFIDALNARLGGGRFSIPTEEQWEFACRAGSAAKWCFGDDETKLSEYAWYSTRPPGKNGEARARTTWAHEIGTKRPNAWGLFDMHGNVSEWCAGPRRDFSDERDESGRPYVTEIASWGVVRGGSFDSVATQTCSGARGYAPRAADARLHGIGLRVAREVTSADRGGVAAPSAGK